jgi:hypothetical protein
VRLASGETNFYGDAGNAPTRYVDRFGLARGDSWDARTYLPDYGRAQEIGIELLKEYPGHNDADDAIRHAEWNRRMFSEIGPFTALSAGLGWEVAGIVNGQPWRETLMDLHNNAEGRIAAAQARSVNPRDLVMQPGQVGSIYNPYARPQQPVVSLSLAPALGWVPKLKDLSVQLSGRACAR